MRIRRGLRDRDRDAGRACMASSRPISAAPDLPRAHDGRGPRLADAFRVSVRDRGAPSMNVSVVIPAYNEAGRIAPSVAKIAQYLRGRRESWEVIVVDDG